MGPLGMASARWRSALMAASRSACEAACSDKGAFHRQSFSEHFPALWHCYTEGLPSNILDNGQKGLHMGKP